MARKGKIFYKGIYAGLVEETDSGYRFIYDNSYLTTAGAKPISVTLPLRAEPFASQTLLPFFDGLIPEGWLLDVASKNWKIDKRDRMGLLCTVCQDCIGAVSVEGMDE
jgi:serine/threonine-protein kinase HipA